ncbi:hypothetical protein GCM10020256_69950 [Streptomyces thermocoprophilus]
MTDHRPVDATTRVEIEQLIAEMLYRLDHNRADTTWELYTEDGVSVGPMGDMDREAMKVWGAQRALADGPRRPSSHRRNPPGVGRGRGRGHRAVPDLP